MGTRILLLERDPPQHGKQLSVDVPNEPGTDAPFAVVYDGKVYRRWVGPLQILGHLGDGDQYVLTTSATATAAK